MSVNLGPEAAFALVAAEAPLVGIPHELMDQSVLGQTVLAAAEGMELPDTVEKLYGRGEFPVIQGVGLRVLRSLAEGRTYSQITEEEVDPPSTLEAHAHRTAAALGAYGIRYGVRRLTEFGLLDPLPAAPFDRLSGHETVLAGLMSRGWQPAQLAERLDLSASSLAQNASYMFTKLGASPIGFARQALAYRQLLPDHVIAGVQPPKVKVVGRGRP